MAQQTTTTVQLPGLSPVTVVAVKLPSGQIVMRTPDELAKLPKTVKLSQSSKSAG